MNSFKEMLTITGRSKARSLVLMAGIFLFSIILLQILLIARNSDNVLSAWFSQLPVEVYLVEKATSEPELIQDFLDSLSVFPDLQLSRVLMPSQAADEFEDAFNISAIENLLGENPFPATVELNLSVGSNLADMRKSLNGIESMSMVDEVMADFEMMGDVGRRLRLSGYYLLIFATITLLAVVVLVLSLVGSFTRNWKNEIILLSQIGAPPMMTARPLLLSFLLLAIVPLVLSNLFCLAEIELLNRFGLGLSLEGIFWLNIPLLTLFILLMSLPGVLGGIRRVYNSVSN